MILPEEYIDQLDKAESPETYSYKHAQLTFDKGTKSFNGEKIAFAINCAQAIEDLTCAPACPQPPSSIDPTALWVANFGGAKIMLCFVHSCTLAFGTVINTE